MRMPTMPSRGTTMLTALAAAFLTAAVAPAERSDNFEAIERAESVITEAGLRAHLRFLASDELRGRGVGDGGNAVATAYLAAAFERAGLTAAGDDLFQHFDLYGVTLGSDNSLTRHDAVAGAEVTVDYEVGEDFYPLPDSGEARVTAELVFAGYGIIAPELKYDDYAGLDVRGKIVVVLRHEPQEHDEASRFAGRRMTDHATFSRKVEAARDRGAVGLIVVPDVVAHPSRRRLTEQRRFWPDPVSIRARPLRLAEDVEAGSIPVAMVSVPVADALLRAPEGPAAGSVEQLQGEIAARVEAAGLDGEVMTPVDHAIVGRQVTLTVDLALERVPARNVVGYIEGTDPSLRSELVVVGAHVDHDGLDLDGRVYNGADDNGSGTAVVLGLIEAMHSATSAGARPRRTIVFAGWNAEEKGLLGSRFYVRHPRPEFGRVVANLNLDMVGRSEDVPATSDGRFEGLSPTTAQANANVLHLLGYSYSPELASVVKEANAAIGLDLLMQYDQNEQDLLRRSDQWPFLEAKIPAVFLTTGLHPDYHTPQDDVDKIEFGKLKRVARLAYRIVWRLADLTEPPRFVEPGSDQSKPS